MLRTLGRLGAALLVLASAAFLGYHLYLARVMAREAAAPSTQQVLVLRDGRQIPLAQPTPARTAASSTPAASAASGAHTTASPEIEAPTPGAVGGSLLPAERIVIPAIGADWPVVLTTADHLPRFNGVGWLLGSAWPGQSGNLVLFGHRGGEAATFARLPELREGTVFTVTTREVAYSYRVREMFETTPDDVAVLAPTDTATATLITCTGAWDPVARTNALRLIVVADLVGDEPATGQP